MSNPQSVDLESWPKGVFALGGLVFASIAGVLVLRFLVGQLLGTPARTVTYAGITSGAIAAVAMVTILEIWATIPESDLALIRFFEWSHVTYLTVAGGLYPTAVGGILGLSPEWYVVFPGAILTAVVWSELLFLLAAVVYIVAGALSVSVETLNVWINLFWLYLFYGVLLGLILATTGQLWLRVLGQ